MSSNAEEADHDSKNNAGAAVGITVGILLLLVIAAFIWWYRHRKKHGVDSEKEQKDRNKDMNALAHTIPGSNPILPQNFSDELTMSEIMLSGTNRGKPMEIMPVIDDNDKENTEEIATRNAQESVTVYDQGMTLHIEKGKALINRKITEPEDTIILMKQDEMQHLYPYEESRTGTNIHSDSRRGTQEDSVIMEKGIGAILKDRVNRGRQITETEVTKQGRNEESLYVTSRVESYPSKTEFTHDDTVTYRFNYKGKFADEPDLDIDETVDSDIYGVHSPIAAHDL